MARTEKNTKARFPLSLQPTEEAVIRNSKTDKLYNNEFEKGRFFQVVFEDEKCAEIQLASRTMMKVVYIKDKNDIEGLELIKLVGGEEKQKIQFNKFNMKQLYMFLEFIGKIDLKGLTERRITLNERGGELMDEKTRAKVATLLSGDDGAELIQQFLDDGTVTGRDIINTGYRRNQLNIFDKLLNEKEYMQTYKDKVLEKPNTKEETAWQLFFKKNPWIFGYGLDYRFQSILQREFSASSTTAAGKDEGFVDFLLGDKKFTTFVELKKPCTPMFGKGKNRSGSWTLSEDITFAVSQILEQKASGQIKIETEKELYDTMGNSIQQRSYDSKTILILGNWDQVDKSDDSDMVKKIKKKTFELYRQNMKNVEILTYDELYDRAKFIVDVSSQKN